MERYYLKSKKDIKFIQLPNCKVLMSFFLVLYTSLLFSQKKDDFGRLTVEEQNFSSYSKDSTAHAIVLYEKGDNYFEVVQNRILLVKEYHGKIKILDDQGLDQGTVSIPFYRGEKDSEKIEEIRGITHNGNVKTSLMQNQIFTNDINERWSEKKFAFPAIKKGSVLEYKYKIISPFIYNLTGWNFQSNIPKKYSEYNAKIPGNYVYNRSLIGELSLDTNEATIKKNCFRIEGYAKPADCEVLKYVMKDVPSFKEEEYMLASSNYISRIEFELSEHHRLDGINDKYTKSWEYVDKEFRSDKDIGRQLTKKVFFEKNVPEALLTQGDKITRAYNIYNFIREHYAWNGEYGIYTDNNVKEAFDQKKGNIGEINISLINLLNAANIPTNIMLLSTRQHGLPKRSHPVISDFNYVIAKTTIDGKEYLLDASDKFTPFGMLPYRCLNHYGRVMDFKNSSYWEDIVVPQESRHLIRAQVIFDPNLNKTKGVFDQIRSGYEATLRRNEIEEISEEQYLENIENEISGEFIITSYEQNKERSSEKIISERFEFEIENLFDNDVIYFNPFLIKFFEKNPFLSENRIFPIDFGYKKNYEYRINIVLPEGYEVNKLPKQNIYTLDENLGILKFQASAHNNSITIYCALKLNYSHFKSEHYLSIKELFKNVIDVQNNSLIILKRKDS